MKAKLNIFFTGGILFFLFGGLLFIGCGDDNSTEPTLTEFEVIQPKVDTYVSNTSQGPVVTAQALFDNINDGNTGNDYFILSVRSANDYAVGHIPGARNIPWRQIADQT